MQARLLDTRITRQARLAYLLYLPPGYEQQAKWPLLLFLHGGGERGSDLGLLARHGIPRLLAEGQHFPFVVAAPQCPLEHRWSDLLETLAALVDALVDGQRVDARRVYLTGMSQGGCGAWHLAMRCPHLFAALAPVCGYRPYVYGYREKALALRDLPVWAFHGLLDEVIDPGETDKMVAALREHGADVRYTALPKANHRLCWERVYAMPELYEWLLAQSRRASA